MHSVPVLMAVWSNAVVGGGEPLERASRLLPKTGIDVPVIGTGDALTLAQLWQAWVDDDVRHVRLFQPRPGRPTAVAPANVAQAAMKAEAILAGVGSSHAVLPRWVRGQLVAWDLVTVQPVPALAQDAVREAEREFAVALREETEWLDTQVLPAGDAELAGLREEAMGPVPPLPGALPTARAKLLSRADQVSAIVRAARAAPEPVSPATRTARSAALNRLETATLTLQEAAASGWVA